MSSLILIVDDDEHTRRLLRLILIRAGHEVVEACDGFEALAMVETAVPDLVILDVLMPNLDGFATLRRIRANPSAQFLPVIFLSSRADIAAEYEGLFIGAQDYLVKPFQMSDLLKHIDALLATIPKN